MELLKLVPVRLQLPQLPIMELQLPLIHSSR
nr:MAG TPA: hypothetical protein [Caudoviricetes sp.]DAR22321.1 MAG TPA: hypothetical protein [Caudoviricetes sp.]